MNKHLTPICVGCSKRLRSCKQTAIGPVCQACRAMLKEVQRWSHEAHHMKWKQEPAAVRRGRMVSG